MLRLRTAGGVEASEYARLFQQSFSPMEKLLAFYERQGYAARVDGRWRFTPKGFLVSNELLTQLLEAQQEAAPLSGRR